MTVGHMSLTVSFCASRVVVGSPAALFAALCDVGSHGRWIPLTRVEVDSGPVVPGSSFVAFSGLGRLALEDRMEVVGLHRSDRGGWCRVVKLGPHLGGFAQLEVWDLGPSVRADAHECVVVLREEVVLPRVLRPVSSLVRIAARAGFTVALWRFARVYGEAV